MEYEKLNNNTNNLNEYWDIAIGLQKVDNLEPSKYLYELKDKNINNILSNAEIEELLYKKYDNETKEEKIARQKECDIVSNRMVEILSSKGSFRLIPDNFALYHGILFKNVFNQLEEKYVGRFRDYNISKKEPILNGESVIYSDYREIKNTLDYDMKTEQSIKYNKLSKSEIIDNITSFTSRIWQVHPFIEGNTRTTAIFIQKHLNQIGFKINNDMFLNYSKYFRNALVRANYYNNEINIEDVYLKKFFINLLYDGKYELSNKELILYSNFNNDNQKKHKYTEEEIKQIKWQQGIQNTEQDETNNNTLKP